MYLLTRTRFFGWICLTRLNSKLSPYSSTYLPSMTNIATVIYEDLGEEPSTEDMDAYRKHMGYELAGAEKLEGTYPFTLESSLKAFRINDFLHRLVIPEHRERFVNDKEALLEEFGLTEEERTMIREEQWIEMIRYGTTFFVLEKMAPVVGKSNPDVYAAMRGEDIETFQKSRNVSMQYSVAGGDKVKEFDE